MGSKLTHDQQARSDALDRIDAAGAEWAASLQAAIEAGCAEDAIKNRVVLMVTQVFGVNPAALGIAA